MPGAVPYPPLELAERVGSLAAAEDPWKAYDELGESLRAEVLAALGPGWSFAGRRALDFGCGAGRTLRHLLPEAAEGEIWGCDIDAASIGWLEQALSPPLRVFVNGPEPPLPQPDGYFDAIWAISVFSHLSRSWSRWLLELHRVLADDGLLLATVIGRDMAEVVTGERWEESRIGMNVLKPAAGWDEGGPMVLHSPWWIRAHWGRAFEILALEERGFSPPRWGSSQCGVLMRKRPGTFTPEQLEAPEPGEEREAIALAHNRTQLLAEIARLAAEG